MSAYEIATPFSQQVLERRRRLGELGPQAFDAGALSSQAIRQPSIIRGPRLLWLVDVGLAEQGELDETPVGFPYMTGRGSK